MPIQQMLLGAGSAVATKTYVDDVFSTYLYNGTSVSNSGPAQTINNGIDVSGKGGLVWIKTRNGGLSHCLFDTVRGKTKRIKTNSSDAEDTDSAYLADFKTNGFEVGDDSSTNGNSGTFASWTFRKAKGFFDVVTYTGSGAGGGQQVAHNLGCIPGCIIIKRTDASANWAVYHRGFNGGVNPWEYRAKFNLSDAAGDNNWFNDTAPTSTHFSVGGDHSETSLENATYVAYVFAGGESTNALARSVDFDGTGDYLSLADSADWALGQTFTIEFWLKLNNLTHSGGVVGQTDLSSSGWYIYNRSTKNGRLDFNDYNGNSCYMADNSFSAGQWTHCALVNNSGTAQWYVNGIPSGSSGTINTGNNSNNLVIGDLAGSNALNGAISNLRIVKGTAVYTSSFRPPTEPLTNITNTKLLCCNNSSTTGSTVTPGTITANGDPTASTDSPFDDPAAFTFGEDGDQGIIKCGSYIGAGNNKINVNLGWEPQFVLIKNTSESSSWLMLDSTRGVVTDGNDARIYANKEDEEVTNGNHIDLTPTGFTVPSGATDSGHIVTYIAIRRPEGYVGKPASAGTDVFAMDGSPTNNFPAWNSGFPVDFAIDKKAAASGSWEVTSRFMVNNAYLVADTTAAEATYGTTDDGDWRKDSNTGFGAASSWGGASVYQAWMWKRHAGFDLVTDTGGGVAKSIPHSLGKVPEMIWRKSRSNAHGWTVYHKGLNGGTTPQNYWLQLSSTDAEGDADNVWNDTAPTSTHFTVGNGQWASDNGATFITMLFASVDGISKVGSYTGNTSSATNSVTTGFQPRFVILKRTDSATEGDWYVYDTTRNWVSLGSNSQRLQLNNDDAQANCGTCVEPTSTGFNLGSSGRHNTNNGKYIYYAHA